MNQFGSYILINRYNESDIKLCKSSVIASRYELFVIETDGKLKKYSYEYEGSLQQLTLESESSVIPNYDTGDFFPFFYVTPDGEILLVHLKSGSPYWFRKFDEDLNLVATSNQLQDDHFSRTAYDYATGHLYSAAGNSFVGMDSNLDFIFETQFPGTTPEIDLTTTSTGRLFSSESNNTTGDAIVREHDRSDGSTISTLDIETLAEFSSLSPGTRFICPYLDNQLVVAVATGTGGDDHGYLLFLDQSLSVQNTLNLDNIGGVAIDQGTGRTIMVAKPDGNLVIGGSANVFNGAYLYELDVENEQRVWTQGDFGDWSLGSSRPAQLTVDTDENTVVAAGIGGDPQFVLVLKPNGEKVVEEGISRNNAYGVGAHYSDIVNYL